MSIIRKDIQSLRGIAVIAVVAFHLSEKLFPYGYLGVDVFFVISGYVLTDQFIRIYQGNKIEILTGLARFFRMRFWRLAPSLFVVLFGSTILIFLTVTPSSHSSFSLQGIASIFLVGNLGALKLNGDYFRPDPNPLLHTWSLSVEEQIYILLPIILALFFVFTNFTKKKFVLVVISLTTISFAINLNPQIIYPLYHTVASEQEFSSISFYSPFERFWQFGIGIITKVIKKEGYKSKFLKSLIENIFIGSFTLSIFYKNLEILATLMSAFIIFSKILTFQSNKILKILTWVGNRSYTIYLVHFPLIYVTNFSPLIMSSEKSTRRLLLLIAFILSILLGSFLHTRVEQKFRLNSNVLVNDLKSLRQSILVVFLVCPLMLFLMLAGSSNKYFGLDKNPAVPLAEWDLAHECNSTITKDTLCEIVHKKGAKVVMLLGDSHAAHIKLSFLEAARKGNFNAVISYKIGCRFYLKRLSEREEADPCLIENLQNFDYIKNNQVDYVIISQRVKSNSPLNSLVEAVMKLKKEVHSVGIISNTPEFPNNPFEQPIIYQLFNRDWQPRNSFRINELPSANKLASDKFVDLLGDQVKTLNLFDVFCNEQACSRVRDGEYLYIDENHFSSFGAQLVEPKIGSLMAELAVD